MFTKSATGVALVLALLAAPVLAQTDTTTPAPMAEGQTPPPPPPGGPDAGGPMKGMDGPGHGRMMPPPPPPSAMIKVALGKDQMLEINCGTTEIAACVEASKTVLDRFLKE